MRAISIMALLVLGPALSACATMVEPAAPSGGTDYSTDYAEDSRVWGLGLGEPQLKGEDLDAALAASENYPLGSMDNPVRVYKAQGEINYLARLRCSDGRRPDFKRRGNVGIGVYGNIIDLYDVDCYSAKPGKVEIYMDMYFTGAGEQRPVPGFTITK